MQPLPSPSVSMMSPSSTPQPLVPHQQQQRASPSSTTPTTKTAKTSSTTTSSVPVPPHASECPIALEDLAAPCAALQRRCEQATLDMITATTNSSSSSSSGGSQQQQQQHKPSSASVAATAAMSASSSLLSSSTMSSSVMLPAWCPLPAAEEKLCAASSSSSSPFQVAKYTPRSLHRVVTLLAERGGLDAGTIALGLALVLRAEPRLPTGTATAHTLHRLAATGIFIAQKLTADAPVRLRPFSIMAGMTARELLDAETALFAACGWRGLISLCDVRSALARETARGSPPRATAAVTGRGGSSRAVVMLPSPSASVTSCSGLAPLLSVGSGGGNIGLRAPSPYQLPSSSSPSSSGRSSGGGGGGNACASAAAAPLGWSVSSLSMSQGTTPPVRTI